MKHEIVDEGDPRFYWTQLPNIVFDIGLSSYEFLLYSYLKRVAGDRGKCYQSTRTLAKRCGISVTTVIRAKQLLANPRADLSGKALIVIKERANPKGGQDYHEISITDIWRENALKYSEQVPNIDLDKQVPRGVRASSISDAEQAPVVERKKNSTKKNPEEVDALAKYKSDPLYAHVDVEREFQKALRWAQAHSRQATPRFFVNWLNKIDVPFRPNGNGRTYVDDVWDKAKTMDEIKAMVEA